MSGLQRARRPQSTTALIPGRRPSTRGPVARTSKVLRSKPPEALVERQVAKSARGERVVTVNSSPGQGGHARSKGRPS